nr:MAG TPA: hypothetical protein [Caudoviricetes sp.]
MISKESVPYSGRINTLIIIVVITIPTKKVMTCKSPPYFIEQEKGERNT